MRPAKILPALLLFVATSPAYTQPQPQPCDPPADKCNQCSPLKVLDSISEHLLRRTGESLDENIRRNEPLKLTVRSSSSALVDEAGDMVEEHGTAEDKQHFESIKDDLEEGMFNFIYRTLTDDYRDAAEASEDSILQARLPSGAEPRPLVPPDFTSFRFTKIRPIIDFETPSPSEALGLVRKAAGGDLSGALEDFYGFARRLGLEGEGVDNNGWSFGVGGFIKHPADEQEYEGRISLKFSSFQGLNQNRGLKINVQIHGKYNESTKEWSAGPTYTQHFSVCTCCDSSLVADNTPPLCRLTRRGINADGIRFIEITIGDIGALNSGLARINILRSINAEIKTPEIYLGENSLLQFTSLFDVSTRSQNARAIVDLEVLDWRGNITRCDPVLAELRIRRSGAPNFQRFTNIPQAEGQILLSNGTPGIRYIEITVNGTLFVMKRLKDKEERSLDVSTVMLPGNGNIITVRSFGEPGSQATLLIHDSPAEGAGWLAFLAADPEQ